MTSPYRGGPAPATQPESDDGIVDDLVRQFADRFAFFRELVQNAIDAGTTRIEVEVRTESAGELRVSVIDDGVGMNADVIENALLVLFRSTKEGATGKIGKFGVGFVSVFAVAPRLVAVETKADGHDGLVLHLHPDHRYELFEQPALASRGTAVRLYVPVPEAETAAFVRSSLEALRRWCRHASLPIVFRSWLDGDTASATEERIDGPLDLEAIVHVTGTTADGSCRAMVGLPVDGRPRAVFLNHGLTLHDTAEPLLGALTFKVESGALGHTLSRDNVRRDAAFGRALAFVEGLARGPLVDAAHQALAAAAEEGDHARYGAVFEALARSGRALGRDVPLFLATPCGGRSGGSVASLGGPKVTTAGEPSELVAALGARGVAFVDERVAGGEAGRVEALRSTLSRWFGADYQPDLAARATLIDPIEPEGADQRLVEAVLAELDRSHRRPAGVVLAKVRGKARGAPCCAGPDGGRGPWVLFDEAAVDPFRLIGRRPLVLDVEHRVVALARSAAQRSPRVAAQLLARAVLLHYGALGEARCAALGDELLEALVTGGQA